MELALTIIAGVIAGGIGVIPFLVLRRYIRAKMQKDGMAGIAVGMAATFVSFVLLAVQIVVCRLLASDYLLPFSLVAIAVFLLAMIVYTAKLIRK